MTPVFESLALVTPTEVLLWVHLEKVTEEIRAHLGEGVQLKEYDNHLTEVKINSCYYFLSMHR